MSVQAAPARWPGCGSGCSSVRIRPGTRERWSTGWCRRCSRRAPMFRSCTPSGVQHRLDVAPPWDLVVLKSGSAAAMHVAAAAQAWGIPSVNSAAATRMAQDKLVVALMLQDAGLPVAPSWATWFDPATAEVPTALDERALVVKAVRGSQGVGIWPVDAGGLGELRTRFRTARTW